MIEDKTPLISVIVPVYKTEKYIGKTMISLVKQLYRNFEVILVDDETNDNAINIAEHILSENSIQYKILKQKNSGQGESRNNGANIACGEWIIFLDSDDIIQPDTLMLMKHVIVENNNIDFIFCDYQTVSLGNEFMPAKYDKGFISFSKKEIQDHFLLRDQVILAPGTLFNSKWLKSNNIFFKKIPYSEDQLFIWEALLKVKKVIKIQKALYNYLQRSGSIMTSTRLPAIVEGYSAFKKIHNDYLKNNEATLLTKKYLLSRWVLGILHSGAKLTNNKEYKSLYRSLEAKKHLKNLIGFPNFRIKSISLFVLIFPYLSYRIFNK